MLARGALCRLAAEVPKTSTHDLPRISQLLRPSLFARHGAPRLTVGAIARAFQATILQGRRAYATKSATEPTEHVKKDVKKTVAKKPATRATAKKATSKKPARKPAAKKKAAAKKKPSGRPKKPLTAEQKEAETIKDLKKRALNPPKNPRMTAWTVFAGESCKGSGSVEKSQVLMKEASAKYKTLTPAEREHYNHLAKEQDEANTAEYNRWIHQHTPEEIRAANYARVTLRRKLGLKGTGSKQYARLIDDRHNTAARQTPYIRFYTERVNDADFNGVAIGDRTRLIAKEWNALSASEKKKYEDAFAAAKAAASA